MSFSSSPLLGISVPFKKWAWEKNPLGMLTARWRNICRSFRTLHPTHKKPTFTLCTFRYGIRTFPIYSLWLQVCWIDIGECFALPLAPQYWINDLCSAKSCQSLFYPPTPTLFSLFLLPFLLAHHGEKEAQTYSSSEREKIRRWSR